MELDAACDRAQPFSTAERAGAKRVLLPSRLDRPDTLPSPPEAPNGITVRLLVIAPAPRWLRPTPRGVDCSTEPSGSGAAFL